MFLRGKFASMNPPTDSDYQWITLGSSEPGAHDYVAQLFERVLFAAPSAEVIQQIISREMLLMIRDHQGAQMGYAAIYDLSAKNRHVHVDLFTAEGCEAAVVMDAWLILIEYLFTWFPVGRVYKRSLDFQTREHQLLNLMAFEEEGRLNEHFWHSDQNWALRIFSLRRQSWVDLGRQRLLDNLAIQTLYDASSGSKSP